MINVYNNSLSLQLKSDNYKPMNRRNRKSIRLKGYNYSQPGWYFVTICTKNREMIFGDVVDGEMVLNDTGEIIKTEWLKTGDIRANVLLDQFVIMPNHVHGILQIVEMDENNVGAHSDVPLQYNVSEQTEQFSKSTRNSIPTIIKLFKSTTTKQINQIRNTPGISVWQRNYYERIIRNEPELNRIRKYIIENPAKWQQDKYYI
jgi:putative transposase